jgi:hypothetical protein
MVCNLLVDIPSARKGSLCYVVLQNEGHDGDRLFLLIRSRSGRWIEKWEARTRLTNFRVKTIPRENPMWVRLYGGHSVSEANSHQWRAQRDRVRQMVRDA